MEEALNWPVRLREEIKVEEAEEMNPPMKLESPPNKEVLETIILEVEAIPETAR